MMREFVASHRFTLNMFIRAFLISGAAFMLACGSGGAGSAQSIAETAKRPSDNGDEIATAEAATESSTEPTTLMQFEEANGFEIYQRYCLVCHGELGEGDGFNAFNLDPKPRSLVDEFMRSRVSDRELAEAIRLGGREQGKSQLMPGWGRTLSDRQIRYVVSYIRLLQRQAQNSASTSANSTE